MSLRGALLLLCFPLAARAQEAPTVSRALAQEILFGAAAPLASCDAGTEAEQISCLIDARYSKDARAAKVANALYAQSGTVMGVLPEQDFNGGYRGKLHLVPRLPVGVDRKHLEWAAAALLDFEHFFKDLGARRSTAGARSTFASSSR